MAVVLAVRNTASLVFFQSRVRAWKASRKAPAAPTAADSVAVVMPNRITAENDHGEDAQRHHRRASEFQHLEALGVIRQ